MTIKAHTPSETRPNITDVQRVLARLSSSQRWPAALHLLTPVELHSPTHSAYESGRALLADQSVAIAGKSLAAGLALIEELVTVTAPTLVPNGPRYLNLDPQDPFTWIKMTHTGAYIHAFGAPELFASPHFVFTPDTPAAVASSIFNILATGDQIKPGRLYLHGTPVWVEGDEAALRISLT